MIDPCENLGGCAFFKNFKGNDEVIKNGWIKLFCENKVKSDSCMRKKSKKSTGKAPPDRMTPTGKIL